MPALDTSGEKILSLDISIFSAPSQTSDKDRKSLLQIQNFIASQKPNGYYYLEVGSHLGGSLVPHILDMRCSKIVSLDPRPLSQPDERGVNFYYADNSTARMIAGLKELGLENKMTKLNTFDLDARDYQQVNEGYIFDLAFIDGEHTHVASFSDFVSLRRLLALDGVCVFHDANLIVDTIFIIRRLLEAEGIQHSLTFLPDCLAVFAFGRSADLFTRLFTQFKINESEFSHNAHITIRKQLASVEVERHILDMSNLRNEVEILKHELNNSQNQVNRILTSRSWKITAPLRKLAHFLHKN